LGLLGWSLVNLGEHFRTLQLLLEALKSYSIVEDLQGESDIYVNNNLPPDNDHPDVSAFKLL
jgi:hypothetical protein